MKVLGNNVYIQRGEEFTIKFGAHDAVPLIIKDSYKHPFIVVTLKSTQYSQVEQYKSVRWLDCMHTLKFKSSKIVHLGSGQISDVNIPSDDTGFKRVYSVADTDGNLTYFYYDGSARNEYSFTFTVRYDIAESNELVDREYVGEVHLIDGSTVAAYLYDLCSKYNLTLSEKTMINAYNALSNIFAKELDNLLLSEPLHVKTLNSLLSKFNLFVEV